MRLSSTSSSLLPDDSMFSTMSCDLSMALKDLSIKLVLLLVSSAIAGFTIASSLQPTASAKNWVCNRVLNCRNLFNLLSD
eukprot:CAMPEP_0196211844 /NCGR_PEP_ID=MMETSP0912-20130531/18976_1 /TAXON_ID=49265 /ORGANISM="Thalassiosira rotula, Strain GSO102" /LENGTH=79 /DNA_ID=CAMNT_0041487527 /DNA_START=39 /DNA_END=275 /DNA_ORIENTATION=+